jgi:hypothetical protein
LFHRESGPVRRKIPANQFAIADVNNPHWGQPADNPGLLSKTETTDYADEQTAS